MWAQPGELRNTNHDKCRGSFSSLSLSLTPTSSLQTKHLRQDATQRRLRRRDSDNNNNNESNQGRRIKSSTMNQIAHDESNQGRPLKGCGPDSIQHRLHHPYEDHRMHNAPCQHGRAKSSGPAHPFSRGMWAIHSHSTKIPGMETQGEAQEVGDPSGASRNMIHDICRGSFSLSILPYSPY